jgi:hypothetical protein
MYEIVKIVDRDLIDDLLYQRESNILQTKPGEVSIGSRNQLDTNWRNCTRLRCEPKMNPEICQTIENHINDGSVVNQLDFLLYKEGDYFRPHIDIIDTQPFRTWTTVTMLKQSDDLEGGSLNLYRNVDDKEPAHRIWLKNGETIIFRSDTIHEAGEVKKGERLVLVAWLYKPLDT